MGKKIELEASDGHRLDAGRQAPLQIEERLSDQRRVLHPDLDRLHQPGRLDEFVEDVLQNILCIARVRHALAYEVPQPRPLQPDRFGDPWVFHGLYGQRILHPPL